MGWGAAGRSRRCRTFSRVSLAIPPTLCQQHSPADDDHEEQGQHVRSHGAGSSRRSQLLAGRGSLRKSYIKRPEKLSSTVDGPRLGRLCSNRGVEPTATRVELRKPRLAEHLERELGYLGYSKHFCIRGR